MEMKAKMITEKKEQAIENSWNTLLGRGGV